MVERQWMKPLKELAENTNIPGYLRETYKILGDKACVGLTEDSTSYGKHSISDIDEIKGLAFEEILAGYVEDGISTQSVKELKTSMVQNYTKDGFFNPMTGVGTANDPGSYNTAFTPVAIGPMEATSVYSSGGLSQLIVDKKAKSVLLNGYQFESRHPFWTSEKLGTLKEYADSVGFQSKLVDGIRDGFIYGGATVYPIFKKDDVNSFRLPLKRLLKSGILTKNCISHWVAIDRWNTVVIPSYDITAADYLFAKQYYIPLAGSLVATERSAVIRPKQLPYWGAIRQLGWGVSDYEGYIRSVLAYNILIQSIPIMAQQMSLLLHEIPLDGIIAQNGVEEAKQFMAENDEQIRKWSMSQPKTVNAFGKVYAVNRQYTGYNDLGMMMRQDIAAQSGIPEAVLFHTQPKGFSNNTEENLLKQSETVRMTQNAIKPSLVPLTQVLIISCFGPDSLEAQNMGVVELSFDSPVMATETERAEAGARYAASLSSLVQAGVPAKNAIILLKQFFRNVEVDKELLAAVEKRELENIAEKKLDKAEARNNPTGKPMKKPTDEIGNAKQNEAAEARDAD